ncbi:Core-2/I-Branching enzyme [Oesophagostomum dentatum]|uniref:Core-2/I-Branching enzyme n=1 Tax=Oesophagostomum dentatum TaxID=61180 RepID=A0A0B1TRN5_OESDE|nr:Core-2/I-Branching enzyme [Oesophagostomum dentatum]
MHDGRTHPKDVDCKRVLEGNRTAIDKAKKWPFNSQSIEQLLFFEKDRCRAIRDLFGFDTKTSTEEELNYPLAYGAVVYRDFVQVLFMLSAFYRPQNEYCVAHRPPIEWGSFEIINTTWVCVELLAKTNKKWMYYQQLSGVDAPLKTNLEMVKIFKTLNNTVNSEFSTFQPERLQGKDLSGANGSSDCAALHEQLVVQHCTNNTVHGHPDRVLSLRTPSPEAANQRAVMSKSPRPERR